jgi:hypothetical protein
MPSHLPAPSKILPVPSIHAKPAVWSRVPLTDHFGLNLYSICTACRSVEVMSWQTSPAGCVTRCWMATRTPGFRHTNQTDSGQQFHFCIRDLEIPSLSNPAYPVKGDTVPLTFGL